MPRQRSDFAVQQEQTSIDLQPEENLYTVSEVAKRLRVNTTTVRRWISIGVLDAVILPHRGKRQAYRIRDRAFRFTRSTAKACQATIGVLRGDGHKNAASAKRRCSPPTNP